MWIGKVIGGLEMKCSLRIGRLMFERTFWMTLPTRSKPQLEDSTDPFEKGFVIQIQNRTIVSFNE